MPFLTPLSPPQLHVPEVGPWALYVGQMWPGRWRCSLPSTPHGGLEVLPGRDRLLIWLIHPSFPFQKLCPRQEGLRGPGPSPACRQSFTTGVAEKDPEALVVPAPPPSQERQARKTRGYRVLLPQCPLVDQGCHCQKKSLPTLSAESQGLVWRRGRPSG